MRQPLWLINSSLLIFFLFAWLSVFLLEETLPGKVRIMPKQVPKITEQEPPKVSIARIYENDLFGTYTPQPKPDPQKPEIDTQPPRPPQPQPKPQVTRPEPSFLDPLAVTLKGIIFTNNEEETRAIIADNTSGEESLYRVGDGLKDSDIVHIGKEKVILMRSNGQQETLFLTQKEAQEDPGSPTNTPEWDGIITQEDESSYTIDPDAFASNVPHLAYFIDELDMTSVFSDGTTYAVRIGNIDTNSIGAALGLQPGDIITDINNITPSTPQKRVDIYQSVLQKQSGESVTVTIERNGASRTHTYTIKEPETPESDDTAATLPLPRDNPIRNHNQVNRSIMSQANKQKQTVNALQQTPAQQAQERGGQEQVLTRTQQTKE